MIKNRFGRWIKPQFWWEEHFTIMKSDLEKSDSDYILMCNKTGAYLARAESPEALNGSALKELDNIFEKNVLLPE